MTLNPRHPGIFISAAPPVRPQPDGLPFYWHRTYPRRGVLGTNKFHATKWPDFNSVGGINPHLPQGKNGDTTLADKPPTLGRPQPAEPKAASEPAYHAYHSYHAHFSHFPRTPEGLSSVSTSEKRRKISPAKT
jgi:hypothetical protein